MKPIHLFRVGTHTSAGGSTISFSEDQVRDLVDRYDPGVFKAPLVIGHPKSDDPAYGWVSGLSYDEGDVDALPDQVEPQFADMVGAGRFRYVSASLYGPDSPSNPKPGGYYLRHVGFLGAQPPAIKGLRPVEFADAEEGVVEFSAPLHGPVAMVLRGLREFIIDKFSRDEADRVVPEFVVTDIEQAGRDPDPDAPKPVFSETDTEVDAMTKDELAQREVALKAEQDKLAADRAALEASQAQFAERATAMRREDAKSFVAGLVTTGKVLPKDTDAVLGFMEVLDTHDPIEFGEGDKAATKPPGQVLRDFLTGLPKAVEFNERAADDGAVDTNPDIEALGREIDEFMESEKKAGRHVTYAAASGHVRQKHAKANAE